MEVAGVDGCPAGWLMVKYVSGTFYYQIHQHFDELASANPNLARILIDIPVGLASPRYPRTIDQKLRKQLGRRSSTVFNTPVRAAIYAPNFRGARSVNKQLTGKSLSIQSLHLIDKIKQVDQYLMKAVSKTPKIYESHPELCFKSLNQGNTLLSKKTTKEGLRDRLSLLCSYEPSIKYHYQDIITGTLRKRVRRDDIIDAFCLCLINKMALHKKLQFLSDEHVKDEQGIEIKIAYS